MEISQNFVAFSEYMNFTIATTLIIPFPVVTRDRNTFEGIQYKILVRFQAERFIDHVGMNKASSFCPAEPLYKVDDL